MERLNQLTERLAAQAVVVAPDDLGALADMHTQVQAIAELPEIASQAMSGVRQSARRIEKLVEQIILREVESAEAAVRQLTQGIADLQQLVQGTGAPSGDAGSPSTAVEAPKATQVEPSGPAAAAVPAAEPTPQYEAQALSADDLPLIHEFIGEAQGHIESAENSILKLEENPQDPDALSSIFRSFHTIKGVAGFLNLKQISALAHSAESLLDLARQGKMTLVGNSVDVVLGAIDLMKAMITAVGTAARTGTLVPVEARLGPVVSRLHACAAGEHTTGPASAPAAAAPATVAPTLPVEQTAPTTAAPATAPAAAPKGNSTGGANGGNSSSEATVKVATDRLDSLINMVGELVIAQSMVAQDLRDVSQGDHRVGRNLSHLGKITRELQELSMSMRMVPIHAVFQKMARLVRDLARKQDKEIELELEGSETELDRNLVEAITDPLVHMVRNAADHGIEAPGDREQLGKPRAGRIVLRAFHQSGNIVIEISDNGRGLNKNRILRKAVQAGIVAEDAQLSDAEIFKLVFHAGLSTAEKVTDVSGRGVGMDVVKRNVEALRGRIDITSVEGQGATFAIRLPLTLAVIDGLVVRVGNQRFIIPILSVEQSLRPQAQQISSVQNRGEMCMVRDSLLPLYRLHRMLGVAGGKDDLADTLVVIVQDDHRRACLLVDELIGQQQVVIKSLGDGVGKVRGVSGGAILGDGNVSLILDVPGLIDMATGKAK